MSFHNHWTTFSLSENNLSKIFNQFFCAKIRVEDSVCCWHFKSLSLISPLASLRRNKCSLHASFTFHILILHVKIRAVIKYNFAHSEPPLQTLPWKKGLDMVFWDKAQPVILRGKKVLVQQKQNQLFKGIFTCQSQGSEREYFPIARSPWIHIYLALAHCLALPPNISADRKSFLGDQFVFPSPPSALSYTAQIYSTSSRKFKDISKNAQINISLKLLQILPSKLFRRVKIVLMKRSHNSTLRVGASQFHMQASCRVMKWWNRFWIFQEKII